MSTYDYSIPNSIKAQNTAWKGWNREAAELAFCSAFINDGLTVGFRGWKMLVTDTGARCTRNGDGERFEIGRVANFETALRLAKAKVNRLEGPEKWNPAYENEALKS